MTVSVWCWVQAGLDVVGQDAETQIALIQISRCVGVYVMDKYGPQCSDGRLKRKEKSTV